MVFGAAACRVPQQKQYKSKGGGGFLAGFFRGGGGVPQGDIMRSVKFKAANRTSLQASMMALR